MKPTNKYEIQFSGLSLGNHVFEWTLEQAFFSESGFDEILGSSLLARVSLDKKERLMTMAVDISGRVQVACDRCGDDLWLPISSHNELVARFASETDLSGDDVIFLDPSEYKLDMRQYIYEFVLLSLPVKRVHPEGQCNPEVEAFLSGSEEYKEEIDPRWEALNNLKNKD